AFNALPLSVGTPMANPQKLPAFNLKDTNGKAFTNVQLKQHWSFIFFGYSNCPDICPATLGNMHQISQRIHAGIDVQFLFITIDPENDSAARLKEYLSEPKFNGTTFVGLTGDKESIHTLAKTIGIHISQD